MSWVTSDQVGRQYARVALVGPLRSGKTFITTTFPKPAYLFMNTENGKGTALGVLASKGQQFVSDTICTVQQMRDRLYELQTFAQQGTLSQMCETLVIDSFSHYADMAENHFTQTATNGKTYMEWGDMSAHFKEIRELTNSLPIHVVYTMLDKMVYKGRDKELSEHKARLPGSVGDILLSSCNVVGLCRSFPGGSGERYETAVCTVGKFSAGSQLPSMPQKVYPNFSYGDIQPHLWGWN